MEMSDFSVNNTIFSMFGLYLHGEDRVTSGAGFIITSGADMSSLRSFLQDIQSFISLEDCFLRDSLNINSLFDVLSYLQVAVVLWIQ